ncbi:hypothetical protein ACEPAF_3418 [Sanghuangporus sanghuang]
MSSSPFRASHRRSRSHTSLSSPSSSPVTRSDNHRNHAVRTPFMIGRQACGVPAVPSRSPFSHASVLAAQPPEKWDVEAWRRGKRARRDPESPSEDADMESCDEPMPSSPVAELLSSSLSMSAPSTPHPRFATTSDAFQFFPSRASSSNAKQTQGSSASRGGLFSGLDVRDQRVDGLEQMHSDAFDELRKTVSEAGEGFVRRMRELEAHRTGCPSRSNTLPSHFDGSGYKQVHYKRGRKRPSPLSARQRSIHRANMSTNRGKASDSEDGISDVEIRSSCASGSDEFRAWSPSKKRAVSLSALSYQDAVSDAQTHSLPFPIPLRSRERSSSPSASGYSDSSDDEERITSSSGSVADRMRNRRALRFRSKPLSTAKHSPPSLSFSFSTSNNSSHLSLGANALSPVSLAAGTRNALSSSPVRPSLLGSAESGSGGSTDPSSYRMSKRTEKAVEALSLALANGAGSVSDYEPLREAQDALVMDDGEAGSLWD